MLSGIVRDMLDQHQRQLDHWLAAQAEAWGLSVEELAERYTLEADPVEMEHNEVRGTFCAEQTYRLRPRVQRWERDGDE